MRDEIDRIKALTGSSISSERKSAPNVTLKCANDELNDSAKKGSTQSGSFATIHKLD